MANNPIPWSAEEDSFMWVYNFSKFTGIEDSIYLKLGDLII